MHPQSAMKRTDPAASPVVPGCARWGDSARARSNPFTHAPEHRKALVGKAQLPQTTTTTSNTNPNPNLILILILILILVLILILMQFLGTRVDIDLGAIVGGKWASAVLAVIFPYK